MTTDTNGPPRIANHNEIQDIARTFVQARLSGRPLSGFPGRLPSKLGTAYRCQDAAIDLWADEVGGWKVGRIPPAVQAQYGSDRLAGPIFRETIHNSGSDRTLEIPVYVGGFAAIEAEFVVVVAADAPRDKLEWTRDEAAELIGDLRIGVEMASSPLKSINDLGPTAIATDFGNNAGLIVGPSIADWRTREPESMTCEAFIEEMSVGVGGAHNLTGGPIRSLQFILELAAKRGRPLRAGDFIATGQTSGIHDILAGQTARVEFAADGAIACKAVAFKASN